MGDDLEHHLAGQQAQPRVLGFAEQGVQGSGQRSPLNGQQAAQGSDASVKDVSEILLESIKG